ncbi:UDP-N-acetylglucosamine--peptide N-acetylglucosaminyltransferase SPINDLY family protein [Arundinibacter roseus]|uniref:Uncharacterized protein n=1 Tax=Arundinibacter roseus TaxID=2070510 RepID=A0A4R4KRI1_9BACT|nr:hypothetical protein [Arundinibacter roseus]TDB69031.1 hypothetical protein EZE20_01475 [Arundinibacter roseus]
MEKLFFWKAWSMSEQRLAFGALGLLAFALILFVIQLGDPLSHSVQWDVLSELSEIPVVVDLLPLEGWQFGVTVPAYLTSEQFGAGLMELDLTMIRLFGVVALLGLCLVLSALPSLPRFWYLGAMILFIVLLAACRPDTLGVGGEGSRLFFLLAVAGYGGISYYFHAFRPDMGILLRFFLFGLFTAILVLVVSFSSSSSEPLLTAAVFSLPMGLGLTLVFILMSSTEIMAGLVWVSTSGRAGKSSLIPFLVISSFYLLNLLLLFLHNTRRIDADLSFVSPLLPGLVAGLLGIWGFKKRADASQGVLSFRGMGFWLYTGLFVVALAFSAFILHTANDPLQEVLEDAVTNSQLAMSALFLFYVLANFYPLMQQGLAVHKVLYKPLRFDLTKSRVFGFAGFIVLISTQGLLPVYQGVAGYFNGLGDLYTHTREYALAEQYYKMALQQEFQNHKSNFALASLALRQDDKTAAAYYYKQATLKNPSPQAYIGLGNVLFQENLFFDAVYSLQEGIRHFPKSSHLLNNLGMLYARTDVADSAYYYLEQAALASRSNEVPASNLLALWAKNADLTLLDSLVKDLPQKNYPSWQANWLAVQSLRKNFAKTTFLSTAIRPDSLLNVSGLAYIVNYSLNQARHDSLPTRLIPALANKNPFLADDLLLASLYTEFYSGDRVRALEIMQALVEEGGEKVPLYRKISGHWLMQLGLYEQSAQAFSEVPGAEGLIGQILANAFLGQQAAAGILLERLPQVGAETAIPLLRKAIDSGKNPAILGDSLLNEARKKPSVAAYLRAVQANPVGGPVVSEASAYLRSQKQAAKAYEIVLNALRFNTSSPLLWEQYSFMSVEQGLLSQATEGAEKVQQLASETDYQSFMSRYQPMRALIEKQREDFR